MRRAVLAGTLALTAAVPAGAQQSSAPPPASSQPAWKPAAGSPRDTRIAEVAAYLGGRGDFDALFATPFREQVPKAQFDAITAQLRDGLGDVTGVEAVDGDGPWQATVRLGFERGIATMRIVVDPAAPHPVSGLLVTGTEPRGDHLAAVDAEFAKLAGQAGFAIYALGDGPPRLIHGRNVDRPAPVGSAFKLWLLAEAARQVRAGERTWSDVVPLSEKSLPSGIAQAWPMGSPMTLHTLATLMISISDNSATDTLLMTLGRDKVGAMVERLAPDGAAMTLPVLMTSEAFHLKTPAEADLAGRWQQLTSAKRRDALAERQKAFEGQRLDAGMFGSKPTALGVEWYASPADMAATLDWIRREGDDTVRAILAINPAGAAIDTVTYAGAKGGSEPGVIAMNWLVRTSDDRWLAITGNWFDPAAPVDEKRFQLLMLRTLRLATAPR